MIRRQWLYIDPMPGNDPPAGDPPAGDPPAGDPPAGDPPLLGGDSGGDPTPLDIPEKFRVMAADGQAVDHQATLQKVLGSYTHLEKRVGTGDLPPKSADEYKLEKYLPEGYEEKPEAMKPILAKMHTLGLTQKQVQGVMGIYGETLGSALATEKQTHQAAVAALQSEWGDKFKENLATANLVVNAIATPEERAILQQPKYSNDPFLLKFLAKVGAEFREDRLPAQLTDGEADNIDALRTSEAYRDSKHPDHKRVVAQVNEAYKRGYKAK
jgi:hypothetical protein